MRLKYYFFIVLLAAFAACDDDWPSAPEALNVRYLRIDAGGSSLFYYGSHHSNDPADPMFEDISRKLEEWQPDIVLIEGGYDSDKSRTLNQAILNGEFAYINYLARKAGCRVVNLEPPQSYLDSILCSEFYAADVMAMYLLRQAYQYQREANNKDIDFGELLTANARVYAAQLNLMVPSGFGDVAAFIRTRSGLDPGSGNWTKINFAGKFLAPGHICHRIWLRSMEVRDHYASGVLANAMLNYKRIFAAMGYTHLDNQKTMISSRLSALMESSNYD